MSILLSPIHTLWVSARQKKSPGLEGKQQEGSGAGVQLLMHLFWLNFAVNWQPQSGAWWIPGTAPVLRLQRTFPRSQNSGENNVSNTPAENRPVENHFKKGQAGEGCLHSWGRGDSCPFAVCWQRFEGLC